MYACKSYPGDRAYPGTAPWASFNRTVGRNLQVAIPPGAVCYQTLDGTIQTLDAAKCGEVQTNRGTDHPISTYWTNSTCYPFPESSESSSCARGSYGDYVVLAKTREHIKYTIDFARKNNLRLSIRNTGHDFMGRSTGWGSLVLNTHAFKDVSFVKKYTGPGTWRGRAVTVGAGIQGRELLRLANKQSPPQVVVTGECPTVGLAGGYIQGGGHGPLATFYGMAADQVLSFEVVTASGKFVTANAASNPDLFWALKGGGPPTFAVIVSVTVKTYDDLLSSTVIFYPNSTHTADLEHFLKGVNAFHSLANRYVENGLFVYYSLSLLQLRVQPFVAPNKTASELDAITFFDLYIDIFEEEGSGAPGQLIGGRIYTRKDIAQNATAINAAQRLTVEQPGGFTIGHIVGPGTGAPIVDNVINPKWREASSFSITSFPVGTNATEAQSIVTHVSGRSLREANPNGAAYVDEGDLEEPNWQQAYWGSNYPRLLRLKKKYDPLGVFYARTTPGTEDWEVIDFGPKLWKKL
ncbi:FAD binding domain-containing protein [Ephemerocybe angulata]|uniref:FAD binding domain-containing protein n=1 Tax=Ephemerocybe angulata TaxID=980116 RepID=A0A8H6M163_9AGAR|nr:FAD binding domain-containing protein [Tulosesus angulatus]